ncbi:hypothetical protein SLE2022_127630 [Rubroshorea leprosula]
MSKRPQETYRTGYALTPKKEQSFIQPSLLRHASERGVFLTRIDLDKPLIEQGPFDCIIHKLYRPDWKLQLQQFSSRNPHVPIIDSPDSIELLHSRISMLEVVNKLKSTKSGFLESFGVPNQHVVLDDGDLDRLTEGDAVEELNLKFPVIAKPLVADGTEISHKMFLIFDRGGLSGLITPVVLQEFVNHGGVIFKVYVVGGYAKCVKRRSLPDISEEKMTGSLPFSQISNLAMEKDEGSGDSVNYEGAEMPPENLVMELAKGLREVTRLNLFNFDLIRDSRDKDRYLVIDINYFPGYAKMPGFESVLTDFFLDVAQKKSVGNVIE